MRLDTGAIVAGYRINGLLGQGGMGVVYEATQLSLERTVALKVLSPDLSSDSAFRERFRREGLIQAALDHPHIVTVYEAGESEHGLFLAMRLIRGSNLKDLVGGTGIDAQRSLRLLSQVADALDSAHEAGLVHRDLKPQNILISGIREAAYLADFGLTKALGGKSLTLTGQLVGTIDYISPEQIQGHPASMRSDIYSLAAVLYECLTGDVPYPRESAVAVLYAHLSDRIPSVTARRPDLPRSVDSVFERALAKDPAERHFTASELVEDVEYVLRTPPPARETPSPAEAPAETVAAPAPTAGQLPPPPRFNETLDAPAASAKTPVFAPSPGAATVADETRLPTAVTPVELAPVRPRLAAAGIAAAVLVAAGIPGFFVGRTRTERPAARSVTRAELSLELPSAWGRSAGTPIPGLALRDALAVAPAASRSGVGVVAGTVAAPPPTFLPPAFAKLIREDPPRQIVRLGVLTAVRYRNLRPRGFAGTMTLFVIPQEKRSRAIACFARTPHALPSRCSAIAASAVLAGGKPYPLTPTTQYAAALDRTVGVLRRSRDEGLGRLRRATIPKEQAWAAKGLAAAHRSAAARLRATPVTPYLRAPNDALVQALERTSLAYARLAAAAAATDSDSGRYRVARQAVAGAERDLERSFERLGSYGFVVAKPRAAERGAP